MSFENLNSFLCSLQLQQYHETFINVGVTDQDWKQLVDFSENELEEFVSAVNMLPFHAIKFKKAVRSLHLDTTNTTMTTTQDFAKSNAIIYGKNKKRVLTSYEQAINRAALELALDNPLIVYKKGQLFDLAKKKLLEEGYEYKRGASRSKLSTALPKRTTAKSRNEQVNQNLLLKRQENAQRMSEKRQEKIQSLRTQVEEAILERQKSEKRLSECQFDDVLCSLKCKADIIKYEEIKVTLSRELNALKAKERKHQWYKKRKSSSSLSNTTDEDDGLFSSQNSSNNDFSIVSSCPSFDTLDK